MARRITGISAESIQDIDDVKTWSRDHEIRMDHRMEQTEAALKDHKEHIKRNSRWLIYSVSLFASALGIVIFLFGIIQMFGG